MPAIVQVNASLSVAPAPVTLQKTGAIISQGGTTLTPGTYQLLPQQSTLASYIRSAAAISTLTWSGSLATATTALPHGFRIGDTLLVNISGVVPTAYNGTFLVTVTGASTFTYPLISDPGSVTTQGAYVPQSAIGLNQANTTFFAQGSIVPVYVLELGPGNATDGVTALTNFIAANNSPQFYYSYLVPRYWDGNAAFLSLVASYEAPDAKTYFFVTTTLQTYSKYTPLMKSVVALIEAPALGTWASDVLTALLGAPPAPTLSSTAGGALLATTYYASITYMTAYGETPAGPEATLAVSANNLLKVTSPGAVTGATGYNVYVGTTAGSETLQNASPINIGTDWTEPTSGLIAGVAYPQTGIIVGTTTAAHNVAVGQWFQLSGFTPIGYNGWYQALGGTTGSTLVMQLLSDLPAATVMGSLVGSLASQTAVPGGNSGEFSAAAAFYRSLAYAPSSANLMTPFAFTFLFGVTPWTTQGNSAILATLKAAGINIIGTGAEGGISDAILLWGTTMDGSDFMEWYSADWAQLNYARAVANEVINGSNNPQAPLYYSQTGIDTLQDVLVGVSKNAVSFGLANGTVSQSALAGTALQEAIENGKFDGNINVNAVPFPIYLKGSPGDYQAGKYAGFSILYIVNRGFILIVINLNLSDFPIQ